MKLDKETIVKHQFWFLLGTYLLIWVIAIPWLKVAAGGQIKTVKDDYKKDEQNLKTANQDPVNISVWAPPWKEYGKTFDGHKRVIWGKAWGYQKDMFDWPEAFTKSKDMYTFQADLSADERDQYKNDLYKKEVDDFRAWAPELLRPVELKGDFNAIFQPQEWTITPTREECWLAQEDFWVKRELFYDISYAVFGQSMMYPLAIDEKEEPKPEGVVERFRFRNPNWEVTLHIRKDDGKNSKGELVVGWDSTIKNVHASHNTRPLISARGTGIVFTLFQGQTKQALEVQGEPVPYGVAQHFDKEKRNYAPKGIDWSKAKDKDHFVGMSQSFDESTCPVRRIDAIVLGKQSCRTYTMPLQPNEALVRLDAPKEDPDKKPAENATGGGMAGMAGGMAGMSGGPSGKGMGGMSGGPSGMPGGPSGMPGGMAGMMGGMGGGATASQNLTPNNQIERNRYLQPPQKDKDEADKPSRHLPLAVQLIVDQGHMQDVLMAFANSRLRIQITQVEAHRVKDYKPHSEKGETGGPNAGPMGALYTPPNMASMYRGTMMQSPSMGGSGAMRPPTGSGSGSSGPPTGSGSGSGGPPFGSGSGSSGPPAMYGGMSGGGMYGSMPGMRGGRPPKTQPLSITLPSGMDRGTLIPKTGDNKKKGTQSQSDQNLVEMTVYGIATLYRRPDAPATNEQPGQSGQSVPPAVGGQPTQPVAPAPADGKR